MQLLPTPLTRTYVEPPDGTRYYDLSHHPPGEAEQLFTALIAFSAIPVRLPYGWWVYPTRSPLHP